MLHVICSWCVCRCSREYRITTTKITFALPLVGFTIIFGRGSACVCASFHHNNFTISNNCVIMYIFGKIVPAFALKANIFIPTQTGYVHIS